MSSSPDSTWLVTGGCGFIGANLVRRLRAQARRIRVFDNCSVEGNQLPDGVEFIKGDVRDPEALGAAVRGAHVIVHLAAQSGVAPSIADPLHDFESNARGTLNALVAARDAGVGKFIFASSNAALGQVPIPFRESSVPNPLSPYGASKLAGEAYCLAFARSYGLPTVALRFANVYGPFSSHKKSVIPTFLKRGLAGQPVTIYGDGSQTRDFIHVDDLCEAILRAGEAECRGEIFQIASGTETPIGEVVRLIADLVPKLKIVSEAPRPGEADRICCSIDKARDLLGFSPAVALNEGINQTHEWFRQSYGPARAVVWKGQP
jgi:UDP-glucose 4-epimerase